MTAEAPADGQVSGQVAHLDNRRTPCAVGLIRAAKFMAGLPEGTVLEMWSKDRFAPYEVPVWVSRDGHQIVSSSRAGWWPFRYYVFRIEKAAPQGSDTRAY